MPLYAIGRWWHCGVFNRRNGNGNGKYKELTRVDNECCEYDPKDLCSWCIVSVGERVTVKRDEPFRCVRCRGGGEDGRSSLQSPLPVVD